MIPWTRRGEEAAVATATEEREVVAEVPAVAQPNGSNRKRIGDLLLEGKFVSRQQIEDALLEQTSSGLRLGELLVQAPGAGRAPAHRSAGAISGSRSPISDASDRHRKRSRRCRRPSPAA